MSTTADSWLNELATRFTPSEYQFNVARRHRESIQTCLNDKIGIYRMFEIGSLKHGTGIWYHSDADFLVSLIGDKPYSPLTTLEIIRNALKTRLPNTTIRINKPAVVCNFSDGDIEVVPGFASGDGFMIPDPTGGWMKSHPEQHNAYVNKINAKHSGGAKKLARHLKIWKYERMVPISSCYLEMRAAKHLENEGIYLPLLDLYQMLENMRDTKLASMNDPSGLNSRFNACSTDRLHQEALSKLNMAVIRAQKAYEFDTKGRDDEAIEQLRLLFDR